MTVPPGDLPVCLAQTVKGTGEAARGFTIFLWCVFALLGAILLSNIKNVTVRYRGVARLAGVPSAAGLRIIGRVMMLIGGAVVLHVARQRV